MAQWNAISRSNSFQRVLPSPRTIWRDDVHMFQLISLTDLSGETNGIECRVRGNTGGGCKPSPFYSLLNDSLSRWTAQLATVRQYMNGRVWEHVASPRLCFSIDRKAQNTATETRATRRNIPKGGIIQTQDGRNSGRDSKEEPPDYESAADKSNRGFILYQTATSSEDTSRRR
jgi:hypothetical protein